MFRSMMFAMMVLVSVCAADTYDSVFVHVYIDDVEYDRYTLPKEYSYITYCVYPCPYVIEEVYSYAYIKDATCFVSETTFCPYFIAVVTSFDHPILQFSQGDFYGFEDVKLHKKDGTVVSTDSGPCRTTFPYAYWEFYWETDVHFTTPVSIATVEQPVALNTTSPQTYTIYTASGQKIKEVPNTTQASLSKLDLPVGMYFAKSVSSSCKFMIRCKQ